VAAAASTGKGLAQTAAARFSQNSVLPDLYFRQGKIYPAGQCTEETRNQTMMRQQGQAFRIYTPTRRSNHEGNAYGLNKKLLDEYVVYPYSAHDDGLDTASRWSDMDMHPPEIIDKRDLEPECFVDGS